MRHLLGRDSEASEHPFRGLAALQYPRMRVVDAETGPRPLVHVERPPRLETGCTLAAELLRLIVVLGALTWSGCSSRAFRDQTVTQSTWYSAATECSESCQPPAHVRNQLIKFRARWEMRGRSVTKRQVEAGAEWRGRCKGVAGGPVAGGGECRGCRGQPRRRAGLRSRRGSLMEAQQTRRRKRAAGPGQCHATSSCPESRSG